MTDFTKKDKNYFTKKMSDFSFFFLLSLKYNKLENETLRIGVILLEVNI